MPWRCAEKQQQLYRETDLVDRDVYKLIELRAQPDADYAPRSPLEPQLKCDCSAGDSQRSKGHRLKGQGYGGGGGVYWDYISLCGSDVNGRWNNGEACHSLGVTDPGGKVWCGCPGDRPEVVYCERTSSSPRVVQQRCTCSSGKCLHQRLTTQDDDDDNDVSSSTKGAATERSTAPAADGGRRSRAQPTVAEMAVLKMQVDEDEEEEEEEEQGTKDRTQQVVEHTCR